MISSLQNTHVNLTVVFTADPVPVPVPGPGPGPSSDHNERGEELLFSLHACCSSRDQHIHTSCLKAAEQHAG